MKNGKNSKRMKRKENASVDQVTSINSQMQFFGLVGQTVNDSDRMLDENSDHVEDTFVVLDEKTKNENLFTITADLPANVAANIAIGEIVVPEFVETETLPKDSNHVLPGEDLEMNNYNVRSIAVYSVVEVIEIKDEAENSEKKRSNFAASVLANPFYLAEGINENLDEVSNSDDET